MDYMKQPRQPAPFHLLLFSFVSLNLALLALCTIAPTQLLADAASSEEQLRNEIEQAQSIPLVEGDYCLVGNVPIDDQSGLGMLLRGRRVTVHKTKLQEFKQHPEKYFTTLQPKAALFTEATELTEPNMGWTITGVVILALILLAGLSAAAAIRYGQDPRKWFIAGLCGNLLAPFSVRSKGERIAPLPEGHTKVLRTALPLACSSCGYSNHPSARQCGSCKSTLAPVYESEATQTRSTK